ncbi:hypothetical protein K458DRAFT_417882 [Lentithecium fluviatile CBS 122367]|uniref:Uncharacterized protein n=1 Tax=Lentithecium fluviatile CBS 122367 TaxID=1168545 RepID=A0A6G1J257_9PLEO|nr:hypothetical protein K458DRAFT_417882 [Lentithecium fluviatile CBS 122367]
MRSFALLAFTTAAIVAGHPMLSSRDLVRPDPNPPNAEARRPYSALPADACGSVDFWYSTLTQAQQYREANSFFWLYPTDTCQIIDQSHPGASSVNRVFVDPYATKKCAKCDFYHSNDCTGEVDVYEPSNSYAAIENVNKDTGKHGNNIGYNSWQCFA